MPNEISLLIVEDDLEFLDTLAGWFTGRGYRVTPVRHPRQALSAAFKGRYDVAILDVTLPEQNGVDLMERLKAIADLEVVLLSSVADSTHSRDAIARGAFECLLKPASLIPLESVVERAAEERCAPRFTTETSDQPCACRAS